jgi:ABC-2 type transport system ATP-binding protein
MIKSNGLVKKFDDFVALDNVTCSIPKGCIYGMVGSNGAGKSTFLRLISGIYKADNGTITIDDEPVFENPNIKEKMVLVPDELFFFNLSNIDRTAKLYKSIYKNFNMERYNTLLAQFGLPKDKPINTFSKGMKRQAATILALSAMPEYILMDETFDGLDPVMRGYVKNLLRKDVEERNATAIITSHSLRELEDTCDQLLLLHRGGVVLQSEVQDVKTSVFKIQVAFRENYDISFFNPLHIIKFEKRGSVSNLIIKGDKEETIKFISQKNPTIFEILPLTLEEVFTCEMEALGYNFTEMWEGTKDEK